MEETFAQIAGAAQYSPSNIHVRISDGGRITGKGVASTNAAITMCGGNINNLLRTFGGIEGGNEGDNMFDKVSSVISWGQKTADHLGKGLEHKINKMEMFVDKLEDLVESIKGKEHEGLVEDLEPQVEKLKTNLKEAMHLASKPKKFEEHAEKSKRAVENLKRGSGINVQAGALSLGLSSVNKLAKHKEKIEPVVHAMKSTKKGIKHMLQDCHDKIKDHEVKEHIGKFLGDKKGGGCDCDVSGGLPTSSLADRLVKQRDELRTIVNGFIGSFGKDLNDMVDAMDKMAEQLGKRIDYDEKTVAFFDTFTRMKEFVDSSDRNAKLHQYLLELNQNMQIDSKEVKERFLSIVRDLGERAMAMDPTDDTKRFAKSCQDLIATVNKYNDEVRNLYDSMRKTGGSNDEMNELFSVDSSKINISGMLNALGKMKVAVNKVWFYRNIAVFRSNLNQTNKEIMTYSKDYTKSVGKAIGEAISKIQKEYVEIINNINDNKTGMGLEIDMYNESRSPDQKISKEKLKMIYKWQCDARIGLYKTVEAIDLYLLHFTETVTKNPDAVADLQKLLGVTRIVAKWYDERAGDNIIRVFESLATSAGKLIEDSVVDSSTFVTDTYNTTAAMASQDLAQRIGGDRANKLYERCRRAVEGVIVLKNIISYFITISEKYGSFKGEKNIYMGPNNIYKNLVNYIWVSALDTNMAGIDIITDNNEIKRVITYKDTEVGIAKVTQIDPELLGINFNRHSIDKLRLLKCHSDLHHLCQLMPALDGHQIARLIQFVNMLFGRLGKTKYIFEMLKFGVVDLSVMNDEMVRDFVDYAIKYVADSDVQLASSVSKNLRATVINQKFVIRVVCPAAGGSTSDDITGDMSPTARDLLISHIVAISPAQRDGITLRISSTPSPDFTKHTIVSLTEFKAFQDNMDRFDELLVMRAVSTGSEFAFNQSMRQGFLNGLLAGLSGANSIGNDVARAKRVLAALNYLVVQMIDDYRREYNNSIFAIDDTYFILTVKAIAGKIMAVTGISSIFKNPNALRNSIVQSPTRLIMGGADENADVIEDAVELYVRLPLMVEFYRRIFDDGNKKFRDLSETSNLDNEQISLVPEVGNIWSGLLINIFDKSKHIDSGLYTPDNMRKIVAEVNSIYKHYKGSVNDDELVRHVIIELVSEINRRYGVIKRQELLNYYRVVNAATERNIEIDESNYASNDVDILNEAMEFQSKSPSDEYIKDLKQTIEDKTVSTEVKINKLTDYKIVKDFRERINAALTEVNTRSSEGDQILSIRERIRFLKRAIASKPSRQEKYDMIIKAIEESDSINQSSNDIFMCFHEFVVVPLRTLSQMHNILKLFILNSYVIIASAVRNNVFTPTVDTKSLLDKINDVIIANKNVLFQGGRMRAIPATILPDQVVSADGNTFVTISGNASTKLSLALAHLFEQMSANAGNLVKLQINTTKHIIIDLSEYQKVCEHLVANVKYMVDKFTGLIPTALLEKVISRSVPDSIYNIEESLVLKIFNKQNKSESARDALCVDNLYKLLPSASKIILEPSAGLDVDNVIRRLIMQDTTGVVGAAVVGTSEEFTMPFIRDAFSQYDKTSGMFITPKDSRTFVSNLLFNPLPSSSFLPETQPRAGLIQEFNIIISRYLNDLYDTQSKKIYTKTFSTFAGSALVDALNGQSIKDFHVGDKSASGTFADTKPVFGYHCPKNQTVLSATLAYAMKVMINRIHPVTSVKIHDVASIQEISPHMLEKYRMLIPMYLRICNAFLKRCKSMRKIVGYAPMASSAGSVSGMVDIINMKCEVKENVLDAPIDFAPVYESMEGVPLNSAGELVPLFIDEIVNAMGSLIHDMEQVQKELLETDSTITLYFDLKKDFTKNYLDINKNLPFAPLSIIAMCYPNMDSSNKLIPIYNNSKIISTKFLYGLRTLLVDNFKISSTKIPYLKKLLSDFNGYSTSGNVIADSKFNDVLTYVGQAANFIYDVRFYNGLAVSRIDPLNNVVPTAGSIVTFQESKGSMNSMSLIESANVVDSTNKVSEFVKTGVVKIVPSLSTTVDSHNSNPRARVIMVNILDMNVMPLNVHSLMREIPLTNLYNYAMTFDEITEQLAQDVEVGSPIPTFITKLLKKPYMPVSVVSGVMTLRDPYNNINLEEQIPASSLRFIDDIMFKKLSNAGGRKLSSDAMAARYNTKIARNIIFLTLVQYIIKKKVKREIEYVNTRVVSDVAAVSDIITNTSTDRGAVSDNMFEF